MKKPTWGVCRGQGWGVKVIFQPQSSNGECMLETSQPRGPHPGPTQSALYDQVEAFPI